MKFLACILASCFLSSIITYAATVHAQTPSTQVLVDEDAGIIRFLIDGEEVGRFTAKGLEVRDDILFGGVITDQGHAQYGQGKAQ
ncbi:MAG: hypothetical protein AB7T86_05025 [Xanthobacteraceae bacterium]